MLAWFLSTVLAVHGAATVLIPKIAVKVTADPSELSRHISLLDLRSVRTDGDGDPLYTLDVEIKQRIDSLYVRVTLSKQGQILSDHENTCSTPQCLDVRSNPARLREEVTKVLDETLFKDQRGFGYLVLVDCEAFQQQAAMLNVRPSGVLVIERAFYRLWWYDEARHALSKETLHYLEPTTDKLQELTKAKFTTARGSVMPDTTPKWMQQFCGHKGPLPPPQFALVMQLRPPEPTSRTTAENNNTVIGK
jgi:hypothetical protein